MKRTLFIVDDHKMLLNGLKNYLEENSDWKVSGVYLNSEECLSCLTALWNSDRENLPSVIIVDLQLGKKSGFELVENVSEKWPEIKCLIYSMYDTSGYILQAMESGAKGYISKVASEEELLTALETVASGGEYIEKRMRKMQEKLNSLDLLFSRQEKIIFEKILQGKSNRQISEELYISSHSVENYVSFIYDKACVHNRHELIEKFSEK